MSTTAEHRPTFVHLLQDHLSGDEKGAIQTFLGRFLRAFAYAGSDCSGATYGDMGKADLRSIVAASQAGVIATISKSSRWCALGCGITVGLAIRWAALG